MESFQPLLRSLFLDISQPWVWDYLLGEDHSFNTTILTSPISTLNSSLTLMNAISLPSNDFQYANVGGFNSTYLGIPAFCVDGIAVGLVILELDEASRMVYKKPLKMLARFAHHMESGTSVSIQYDPDRNFAIILHLSFLSASLRRRTILQFDMQSFKNAFTKMSTTGPDIDGLLQGLLWSSVTKEQRQCPECNAPGSTWCGCTLASVPVRHSLDFERIRFNFDSCMGDYKGKLSAYCFEKGKQVLEFNNMDSFCQEKDVICHGLSAQFLQWAIQSGIHKSVIHPRSCEGPLPILEESSPKLIEGISTDESGNTRTDSCTDGVDDSVIFVADELNETLSFINEDTSPIAELGAWAAMEVEHLPEPECLTPAEHGIFSADKIAIVSEARSTNSKELFKNPCEQTQSTECNVIPVPDVPDNMTCTSTGAKQTGFVPIAPMPSDDVGAAERLRAQEQERLENEKRRKEEQIFARKLRNREAAARSNLKRKLRNAAEKRERNVAQETQ